MTTMDGNKYEYLVGKALSYDNMKTNFFCAGLTFAMTGGRHTLNPDRVAEEVLERHGDFLCDRSLHLIFRGVYAAFGLSLDDESEPTDKDEDEIEEFPFPLVVANNPPFETTQ